MQSLNIKIFMKTIRVTDYTNYSHPLIMSKFNSPKNKKKFIKFAQKGEAHVQCVNNHNTKFENKGMKTARV